jgi:hypothetical protein
VIYFFDGGAGGPSTPIPPFANVSLLVEPGNAGAQGDGSTTFTDLSSSGHIVTANGNAQVDTGVLINGYATLLMDGTGDFLSVASHASFGFGTGDFTAECWVIVNTFAGGGDRQIFDFRPSGSTNGMMFLEFSTGRLGYYNGSNTGLSGTAVPAATARHIAISRVSGTLYGAVNGAIVWSATMTGDFTSARACRVFANFAGTAGVAGNANMIRVCKGIGLYTSSFTPPTSYPHS